MDDSLRYLQAIIEHGNLSRAAASLYISQPALSRYVARMEKSLDVKLIARGNHPLTLTPEGQRYCDYLQGVEQLRTALEADLEGMDQSLSETVRLGATTWRSTTLLPRVIPELLKAHPDLRINLFEGSNSQLHSGVRAKKLDIAVINAAQAGAGVHFERVATEGVILTGRVLESIPHLAESARRGATVSAGEIKGVLQASRLILMHPEHNLGAICRDFLMDIGVRNRRVTNTNNVTTSIELSARGAGLAFAPVGAVPWTSSSSVPHVHVGHAGMMQDIGLAWPLEAEPRGLSAELADALRRRIESDGRDVGQPAS